MSQRVRWQQILSALPSLEESQGSINADDYEVFDYQPGAIIIREGDSAEYFYIITQGEVEVLRQHPGEPETVVATLGSGRFFGELGLLRGGKRFNTVRAAATSTPVQVIALNRRAFQKLVNESNLTKDEIAQVMKQRLANTPLS
jgi:CRP-like cAMP-binding protein